MAELAPVGSIERYVKSCLCDLQVSLIVLRMIRTGVSGITLQDKEWYYYVWIKRTIRDMYNLQYSCSFDAHTPEFLSGLEYEHEWQLLKELSEDTDINKERWGPKLFPIITCMTKMVKRYSEFPHDKIYCLSWDNTFCNQSLYNLENKSMVLIDTIVTVVLDEELKGVENIKLGNVSDMMCYWKFVHIRFDLMDQESLGVDEEHYPNAPTIHLTGDLNIQGPDDIIGICRDDYEYGYSLFKEVVNKENSGKGSVRAFLEGVVFALSRVRWE